MFPFQGIVGTKFCVSVESDVHGNMATYMFFSGLPGCGFNFAFSSDRSYHFVFCFFRKRPFKVNTLYFVGRLPRRGCMFSLSYRSQEFMFFVNGGSCMVLYTEYISSRLPGFSCLVLSDRTLETFFQQAIRLW